MSAVISFNYNFDVFNRAMSAYQADSKRSAKTITDHAGADVAANFVNLTEHSSEQRIDKDLGVVISTIQKVAKTGRVTKKKVLTKTIINQARQVPLIFLIVNWSRALAGLPPVTGAKMEKAAMKLRNLRKRAINFIRSAGLAMGKKLWAEIKGARTRPTIRRKEGNEPLGDSIPATEGYVAKTSIMSFIHGSKIGDSPTAMKVVEKGMAAALGAKAEDYMKIVAMREEKKLADKFNATKH